MLKLESKMKLKQQCGWISACQIARFTSISMSLFCSAHCDANKRAIRVQGEWIGTMLKVRAIRIWTAVRVQECTFRGKAVILFYQNVDVCLCLGGRSKFAAHFRVCQSGSKLHLKVKYLLWLWCFLLQEMFRIIVCAALDQGYNNNKTYSPPKRKRHLKYECYASSVMLTVLARAAFIREYVGHIHDESNNL